MLAALGGSGWCPDRSLDGPVLVAAQSTALPIDAGLRPARARVRRGRVAADRRHRGARADPRVEEGRADAGQAGTVLRRRLSPPHRTRRDRGASDRDGAVDADQRGVAGAESARLQLRRSRASARTTCCSHRSIPGPQATTRTGSMASGAPRWSECGAYPAYRASRSPGAVPLAPGRQRQPWVNPTSGDKIEIDTNFVGPRYFQTLGIPRGQRARLHRGRWTGLAAGGDRERASRADVLAAAGSDRQGASGAGLREPIAEVVGVVRDVKYRDLRGEAGPMFYRPVLQTRSTDAMTLHVRASSDPGALVNAIRLAIQNDRPQRAVVPDHDPRGTARRVVRADAPGGAADRDVRWARAAAQRGRRLRRDRTRGEPADSRYRHSHGARCTARAHRPGDWQPARSR